jgi:excisionase family DNA binding protein
MEESTCDTSKYLTIGQAAEHLGVSRHTIRRLIKAGKLSSIKDWYDARNQLIKVEEINLLKARISQTYFHSSIPVSNQGLNR